MTAETETTTKPTYEDYLAPHVVWWPWWVAIEYLRRATLSKTSSDMG